MKQENNFFENAINSLAKVKQDTAENKFDVSNLEVVYSDGEILSVSVHQDWELSAQKSTRKLSGINYMDINCNDKKSYQNTVIEYMQSVSDDLPHQLLEEFKQAAPFCHCENFIIDETSIGVVEKCSPCKGSGKVTCSVCGGSGMRSESVHVRDEVVYSNDSYNNRREISRTPVYETRTYTCGGCNGTGLVTCSPCAGTGYITNITDVIRKAQLFQTYAAEDGKYSDQTIAEVMKLPTNSLINFTTWQIGQSTSQDNHVQIQYITQLAVTSFATAIAGNKYTFMSFYDYELDSPHIFEKSPILDYFLEEPLKMVEQLSKKLDRNMGYKFLELFNDYKLLCQIMLALSNNPNYSKKNISQLVKNESNNYLSDDRQKVLVLAIIKTFKSCVPTYSTKAMVFSTIWLVFIYEIFAIPILPLARSHSFSDWLIVITIMTLIFTSIAVFVSKKIVDKKYTKLPEAIVIPKAKHLKMALRFAGAFLLAGLVSIPLHDDLFDKYLGGSIEHKLYSPHLESNEKTISNPHPTNTLKNN